MEIKELKTSDEIKASYAIMHELRDHLSESAYLELLKPMMDHGYRLFALYDDNQMVSVAGIQMLTNLYYQKHVWIYDLVTKNSKRSKGYGKKLLEHIEHFAHDLGCQTVALSSGLERTTAHNFYEQHMGYDKPSYVFKKELGRRI